LRVFVLLLSPLAALAFSFFWEHSKVG
jgi:hypothetical protein